MNDSEHQKSVKKTKICLDPPVSDVCLLAFTKTTEYIKTELKIQIEWRQPALDQIDSPLNLSLCFYSAG